MTRKIMTVEQAVEYQRNEYGHVVFGKAALYRAVRVNHLRAVRVGRRRLFILQASLDALLEGNLVEQERA